ncbi:MAG: lytic transglycosylase domain-containing protein [Rhodospirillaceae bacterium]
MLGGWRAFKGIVAVLGIVAPLLTPTPGVCAGLDVQRMVIEEAMKSRVPPALALAVARVESNFEPRAQSPVGAMGVMQIMPKTARDVFGVPESQLFNARLNIRLGITFLEQLYNQYGQRWDLALSHYNGGTLAGGTGATAVPHSYTRKYVADVQRWQRYYENPGAFRSDVASIRADARARRPAPGARRWQRFDPLEYDEWADIERRRLERRRELDDFARRR